MPNKTTVSKGTGHKKFTYGDLWGSDLPKRKGPKGRFTDDPSKYTTKTVFLDWIKDNGYTLVMDYDLDGAAKTNFITREIILNANYPDAMFPVFLQHELGHLIMFNTNQFVSVRDETSLKSLIADVLYVPKYLNNYRIESLLRVENIIQDIIIETLSPNCVCNQSMMLTGEHMGVKHLESMESVKGIAREVCANYLGDPDLENEENALTESQMNQLKDLVKSILEDMEQDRKEIQDKIDDLKKGEEGKQGQRIFNEVDYRASNQVRKKLDLQRKLQNKIDLKPNSPENGKLQKMIDDLQDEIEKMDSDWVQKQVEDAIKKELESTERKLSKRQQALDALKNQAERVESMSESMSEQMGQGQGSEQREGQGRGEGDQSGENSGSSGGNGNGDNQLADSRISSNTTDHLHNNRESGGSTHTFDSGFPPPTTVKRDDKNALDLASPNKIGRSRATKSKVFIDDDSMNDDTRGRRRINQREMTYYKPSKLEYDNTDMIPGKERLKVSGSNILIGLDVSGSMTEEWTSMFETISNICEKIKESLDVEKVVYFTYHTVVENWSENIKDLHPHASGGNAFGYVYQQMLRELPIMQKNLIILVTDCGDNLGFTLNDTVEAEKFGETVQNHISVIDTEKGAFYDASNMDQDDWSLYPFDEPNLYELIENDLENLLEQ